MGRKAQYPEGKAAVTVGEAAAILGISERTMAARVGDGTVKAFKIGKLVRVTRKELERIMEGNGNERERASG